MNTNKKTLKLHLCNNILIYSTFLSLYNTTLLGFHLIIVNSRGRQTRFSVAKPENEEVFSYFFILVKLITSVIPIFRWIMILCRREELLIFHIICHVKGMSCLVPLLREHRVTPEMLELLNNKTEFPSFKRICLSGVICKSEVTSPVIAHYCVVKLSFLACLLLYFYSFITKRIHDHSSCRMLSFSCK